MTDDAGEIPEPTEPLPDDVPVSDPDGGDVAEADPDEDAPEADHTAPTED